MGAGLGAMCLKLCPHVTLCIASLFTESSCLFRQGLELGGGRTHEKEPAWVFGLPTRGTKQVGHLQMSWVWVTAADSGLT